MVYKQGGSLPAQFQPWTTMEMGQKGFRQEWEVIGLYPSR